MSQVASGKNNSRQCRRRRVLDLIDAFLPAGPPARSRPAHEIDQAVRRAQDEARRLRRN